MRTIKMKRGIIAFLLFSGLTSQVFGVDLYWRSKAVSNNFNDAINWVTDPAEIDSDNPGSTPALIPGQNDDVHFTVASTYQTLVATGNKADVHSIYCSAPADYVLRNTNLNIYGSISSNGKFSLNGGNTSCVGSDPATIDLGTDDRLSFGGMFTINKTAATKIELVNRGLNISSGFVFAEGQFNSNGYDIAATLARFSALTDTRTVDLAGSTLTLFGENDNTTQIFENNLHPECDLIIYNLGSEIRGNVTFRSITFANPRYHTSRSSAMTYFTAEDFIVNTPAINFTPTFGEQQRWCKITVTGKLEFLQPAGITIDSNRSARAYQYPDTLNINEIVFEPADCFERSALVSSFSVVLNATGNAIATQNITFRNVEFGGAGFTASASDDGGLNSGTVTWNPVTPKNYYWTGGAGMWDDPDHWTLDPAGNPAASNGCIPTATDNVFFKDFSFAASGQEVTLQVPATCNNITWDDPDREGILQSATSLTSLAITGNVDFSGAQAVNPTLYLLGKKGESYTLNSGSEPVYNSPNIFIYAFGSTYTLTSDFIMNAKNSLVHTAGTLVAAGQTLDIGRLESFQIYPAGATRSLDFQNAEIYTHYSAATATANVGLSRTGLDYYNFTGSHFFISGSNATNASRQFTITGQFDFHDITFDDGGVNSLSFSNINTTVNNLTINGNASFGSGGITTGFTVNNLILAPNRSYTLGKGTSRIITVNNNIDSRAGSCGEIVYVSGGIIQNNTNPGKALSISGGVLKNVEYRAGTSGFPNLEVPGGIDDGGNINVSITPPPSRTFYWVGGSGNWSDPERWSLTSGVWDNPDGCLPSILDDVYFDGGSFTGPNQMVTVDLASISIHTMIWTPEAGAMTPRLDRSVDFNIIMSGSMELAEGMTIFNTANQSQFTLTGTSTEPDSHTITTNGVNLETVPMRITGTGRFDLKDDISSRSQLQFNGAGSFYTNNHNLKLGSFALVKNSDRTIDFGNSVIESSGGGAINFNISNCDNFISENSSITTGNCLIGNSCPLTFKSMKVSGNTVFSGNPDNLITVKKMIYEAIHGINGTYVTDTLVLTSRYPQILITGGRTLTVNRAIVLECGTPCQYIPVKSTNTTPVTLKLNYCDPELYFAELSYVHVDLSGVTCENNPQTLTVYGREGVKGSTTNVTYLNPFSTGAMELPARTIACTPYIMDIGLGNIISFQWLKDGKNIPAAQGGTARILSVSEPGVYRLLATYSASCVGTFEQTITSITDSLIWAGAVDSDWNNPLNWEFPEGGISDVAPDVCVDVLIPQGKIRYPDLLPISGTDYTRDFYDKAACKNIHFEHGGEVRRTDSLHYEKVFVAMQLNSNQWYMLSAPLKNTYSGDFYINTPNPIKDLVTPQYPAGRGLLTYMMHFGIGNYQTGADKIPYSWNNTFHTNDIELLSGQGFALFSNPRSSGYGDQNELEGAPFRFPKHDSFYYYYDRTGVPFDRGNDLTRTHSHRFIYEGEIDADGLVPLNHSSLSDGQMVLVGNPFMSQLDFDAFVTDAHNAGLIYDEYKIAAGVNGTTGLVNDFSTYKRIDGDWLTINPANKLASPYIAPMQSFIVYARPGVASTDKLKADIEHHTATAPTITNNHLRSSSQPANKELLYITAKRDGQKSHAVLVHWLNGNKNYLPEEDSRKLFDETTAASVLVYLQSSDKITLDINTTNDLTEMIPIGIRTSQTGEITLNFSGMNTFVNRKIYLQDLKFKQIIDLHEQSEYTFIKDEADMFIENRFYIAFGDPTGLDTQGIGRISIINPAPRTIQILSDKPLESVEIIDLQGLTLMKKENIGNTQYNYQTNAPGVYIAKVMGEARKIIVK